MRIAILSDSHDHIPNLYRAVKAANTRQADILLHCGDLISPFMLKYLQAFNGPVHLIYGNNAGDKHLISARCGSTFAHIRHHGMQAYVRINGYRICMNHYPEIAKALAQTGDYDLVCCGHNHISKVEHIGHCLLINPGDLLGKEVKPGFILLNTDPFHCERVFVGDILDFSDVQS